MSDDPQSDDLAARVARLERFWFGPPDDPDDVPRSVHVVRMIRRAKAWRELRQYVLLVSGGATAILAIAAALRTFVEWF